MERCSTLRDSLVKHFADQLTITGDLSDQCILTFPIKTLDSRLVSVIVEEKMGNYYTVHDGGKTESALFCEDLNITDSVRENQKRIARVFGVNVADRLIQKTCRREDLSEAIESGPHCQDQFSL